MSRAEFTFDGLLRFLNNRLAYFMVPRYYGRIDAMPLTQPNRIEKYRLREAGNSEATWDCQRFGYRITRHALLTDQRRVSSDVEPAAAVPLS